MKNKEIIKQALEMRTQGKRVRRFGVKARQTSKPQEVKNAQNSTN